MSEATWAWVRIVAGLALLVGGGDVLVRGASRLAATVRVSALVIGLTVVAFGTSAPELAVSVRAAWTGSPDLALGNVVGSNIFNVLFILGVSALIAPLLVSSQLVRWDVPLMIVASLTVYAAVWDGKVQRIEGLGLVAGIVGYTAWTIRQGRRETAEVKAEFAKEWPPRSYRAATITVDVGSILVGLILLGWGARWLIDGASRVAIGLGVSELVVGLTVVAAGTSLPEVVTSVMAAVRGERDIAVGNVVGSNIFNILCVLGFAAVISPTGVAVSRAALELDIPVMVAVTVACLPIFWTGNVISRWEGGLFLFYYVAYTSYLVLQATGHAMARPLREGMLIFVLPLTGVTMAIVVWRSWRCGIAPPAKRDISSVSK